METVHHRLGVTCPICQLSIGRPSDFRRHIDKVHGSNINVPPEAYRVKCMRPLAVFPDDFRKVYGDVSDSSSGLLFWLQMCPNKTEDLCYISITHLQTDHGRSTVEGRLDDKKFRATLSDSIFKHPIALKQLSKRMARLPVDHQPFIEFSDPVPVTDASSLSSLARKLGIDVTHITTLSISSAPVLVATKVFDQPGSSTPLLDERTYSLPPSPNHLGYPGQLLVENPYHLQVTTTTADVPASTSSSSSSISDTTSVISSSPTTSTATVTSDEPVETTVTSSSSSAELPSPLIVSSSSEPPVITTTSSVSSLKLPVSSTSSTIGKFKIPLVKSTPSTTTSRMSLQPPPTKSRETEVLSSTNSQYISSAPRRVGPSLSYRATKLLRMGAIPLFPPARRNWSTDEAVTLSESSLQFKWPPLGWQRLSPDQRLMRVEFVVMQILTLRNVPLTMERSEMLLPFNFLVLPGSLPPREKKGNSATSSCFHVYQRLREMAITSRGDEKWLHMIECASMMRDVTNDHLLKQIERISLRLSK